MNFRCVAGCVAELSIELVEFYLNPFQAYADELYNRIEVEAVCNSDSNQFVFNQQEDVLPVNGNIYLVS